MTQELVRPLGGHAVFLLLVQLALLLLAARLGAELARRMGLPAVVGELAAGIALGPSLLGHFAPGVFATIFPQDAAQFHLIEVVGTLGMALLLLSTGLETDLRLLRNLGRAALIASAMGMVIPFASGFGLGLFMPEPYLANPQRRILFSFFLATAMAISAMPVIAKILMDLDLTKRNIGLVILSAGVVDDTAGWLILSVIAGTASHGEVRLLGMVATVVLTLGFLLAAAFVLYPVARWTMSVATRRFKTPDADLVLLLVVTLLCAATTEWIGIHAVFGAFVAGTVFRQVPELRAGTVERLESFVFSVLAPVFFGIVGLKVDLWALGGGRMLLIVLAVACLGKLVGCTLGSIWGGLRFWEGLSIAVAMNARGAMELVVATIGLTLGILNQQMFSIIVVVAIVTSFLAPLGLRLTMRKVRLTEDENRRILAEQTKGVFDPARVRVLLPIAGGQNAAGAARLAAGIAQRSAHPVVAVYVEALRPWFERLGDFFRGGRSRRGEAQLALLGQLIVAGLPPEFKHVRQRDAGSAIVEEARKGFDLVVLGASRRGNKLGGPTLEEVTRAAPCHVAIVRAGPITDGYRRLLVPFDGGLFSKVAVEFAVRYSEVAGAELTVAVLTERRPQAERYLSEAERGPESEFRAPSADELERISPIFKGTRVRPSVLHLEYDPSSSAVEQEVESGRYDLVVIGAENRAVQHRLFFGYENERMIIHTEVAVAIVVPNIALLG